MADRAARAGSCAPTDTPMAHGEATVCGRTYLTTRFLWFNYSTSDTHIFTAREAMTLNEREYAAHRNKIRTKLGIKIDAYIDDLPI